MISAPRVSIVTVNRNYERYIAEAIQSVKDQTYENIECIIVDNGSDDRSLDTIADAVRGNPQFTLHRLSRNLGHLGGCLFALEHVRSEFVVFLDADDVLFPEFVKTHVQVHIGTERPTGFTSSSCVNLNGDGEALTGGNWWKHSWKNGEPSLRPMNNTVRLAGFDASAYSGLAADTRYIPAHRGGWSWSVGSSNMYRRALLERFRPRLATDTIFGGTDGFFTPILHAITGTNLIDRPLNVYRIHGANTFARLPALIGVRPGHDEADKRSYGLGKLILVSLIDGIENVLQTVKADRYWQVVDTAASVHGPTILAEREVKEALIRQYKHLAALSSERSLIRELRNRMNRSDCLEVVLASRKGMPLVTAIRRAASVELRRKFGRREKNAEAQATERSGGGL